MEQLDLIDIYRTFHPKTMNSTFFSSAHGTFSRIDHILHHRSSPGKFKKIEIIPVIFSDHSAVRLDLNYRKKIFHANGDQKKAGVTILISNKIDFKIKAVKRDKEGHYIMIKGSIQEDITIINIYAPNIGALQ